MSKKKKDPITESAEQQTADGGAERMVEEATAAVPEGDGTEILKKELEDIRDEAKRNYDHYLRAVADLDNYRKRAQREKEDLSKFANERILREILPVIDNLERAVEHARQDSGDAQGLLQGVEMTLGQFGKALEKFGVRSVSSVGEPFDPARHEAMGQLETADQAPNTVVQELQKGYLLHERLLRPALVMVAKAPAAAAGEENGGD